MLRLNLLVSESDVTYLEKSCFIPHKQCDMIWLKF